MFCLVAKRRRQDEDLDQLSTHVVRIGELGKEMGQELHLQGQLLDELDTEIEGTSTRIAAAQKKVRAQPRAAGGAAGAARWRCAAAGAGLLSSRASPPCKRQPHANASHLHTLIPAAPTRHPQVEYVLQKAGSKGQLAIIGFLVLLLIVLIFLLIA